MWAELMHITRKVSPDEVSGVGEIEIVEDTMFVSKIYLIGQKVDTGSTEFDSASFAKFLIRHEHPEKLKLWWHTHGAGGVFWSSTDTDTIRTLRGVSEWLVSLVLNRQGEYMGRLDMATPVVLPSVKLVIKMDEKLSSEAKKEWDKEIKEKVTKDELPLEADLQLPLDTRSPSFINRDEWRSRVCGDCATFDRDGKEGCFRNFLEVCFQNTPACSQFEEFELSIAGEAVEENESDSQRMDEVARLTEELNDMKPVAEKKRGKPKKD